MILSGKLKVPFLPQVVCLSAFFLLVNSLTYRHNCNNDGSLSSWPSIAAGYDIIFIDNCANLLSVPALAASGRPELLEIWLELNMISQINETWLLNSPNIRFISIYGNKISSIPAFTCGAAGSEGCPELNHISLSINLITNVPARSFANLPKLENLYLRNNNIATLANRWIIGCPIVKGLWFHRNANLARFLVSEDLNSRGLADLEILHLYDSGINSLDPDLLLLYPKLKELKIYGTRITKLPMFVTSHPVKIDIASMGNFVCDCSATKLAKNGMIISTNEIGFCSSPDYNVGKSFSQLECRETAMTRNLQPSCVDVTGGVTSTGSKASMEFLQNVGSGESDIYVSRVVSECSTVSVRLLVSGSRDTRATYQLCRLEAFSSSTECRFRCKCPHVTCYVFTK